MKILATALVGILSCGCASVGRTAAAILTGGQSELIRATVKPDPAPLSPIEPLVAQVKALDTAHEAGQISASEYWALRGDLMKQISTILQDRERLSESRRQAILQTLDRPPPPSTRTKATITDPFGVRVLGHIEYETEPTN